MSKRTPAPLPAGSERASIGVQNDTGTGSRLDTTIYISGGRAPEISDTTPPSLAPTPGTARPKLVWAKPVVRELFGAEAMVRRLGAQSSLGPLIAGHHGRRLSEVGRDTIIGDRAAYQLAVGNIRASAHFLLHSIGPQAARRALAETTAALEEDIKFANANSQHMQ